MQQRLTQAAISSATVANTRKLRALSRTERSKVENWRVRSLEGCGRSMRRYSYEAYKAEAKAESIRGRNVSRKRNERGGKSALKHKIVLDELRYPHSAHIDHIDDDGYDDGFENHGYPRPMRPCSPKLKLRMVHLSRAQALRASASPASSRPHQHPEMTTTQVIARIRALSRQQDRCLWHTRSSRCQLEQIRNELRGDTSLVAETVARGHTASFWCSCKAASQASAVFSADVEAADDDVVMKRWKAASLGAQAVTSSTPRETLRAASGSVPLARELVGTFVGKQGIRITALQMELNGGGRAPKGHYNERVVLTVRELPLLGTFEVAFVCAEKRLSDVFARLVRAIEDAKIEPARKSASRVPPACRGKRGLRAATIALKAQHAAPLQGTEEADDNVAARQPGQAYAPMGSEAYRQYQQSPSSLHATIARLGKPETLSAVMQTTLSYNELSKTKYTELLSAYDEALARVDAALKASEEALTALVKHGDAGRAAAREHIWHPPHAYGAQPQYGVHPPTYYGVPPMGFEQYQRYPAWYPAPAGGGCHWQPYV